MIKIFVLTTIALLPIIQLFRDWKHSDTSSANYKRITQIIMAGIFLLASVSAYVTYKDNAESDSNKKNIEEVAKGNKTLLQENEQLRGDLSKYKDELLETRRQLIEKADNQISSQREIISLNQTIAKDQRKMAQMGKFVAEYHQSKDSYCYLNFISFGGPSGQAQMIAVHSGKYPLLNVRMSIIDQDVFRRLAESNQLSTDTISQIPALIIGDMQPRTAWPIPYKIRLPLRDSVNYLVEIFSLHGNFTQILKLRRIDGRWKMATKVHNGDGSKTLFELVDKDFPRDVSGRIVWE